VQVDEGTEPALGAGLRFSVQYRFDKKRHGRLRRSSTVRYLPGKDTASEVAVALWSLSLEAVT
jgi:hypothetical protein